MPEITGVSADEVKQVQDYVRREFGALMRPLKHPIYHYTTGAAAAEIIEHAKIRASNILFLDDGREMQHAVDYFRRAMADRENAHPGQIWAGLNAQIETYLARTGGSVPPDIWIATFSANRDSAHQWDGFSGESHGVSLGLAPPAFNRAADAGGVLLAPCCYDDDAKLAIMGRGLDVLERLYERRVRAAPRGAPETESLVRYVTRELALFGALMKRSELAHENEWRLILCNPSQTAIGARRIMALPKPEYTALYIDIDLADVNDRLPFNEILVGPSRFQQLTARAFRTLLYKHGYEQVDVIRTLYQPEA
jgi:hypothetical protein